MNIQISNVGPKIKFVEDGKISFFNLDLVGSIEWVYEKRVNKYKVKIDFIADGRYNRDSLEFYLVDVINQVGWTNDTNGANTAVSVINGWSVAYFSGMLSALQRIDAGIPAALGKRLMTASMSVTLASDESEGTSVPNLIITSTSGTIDVPTRSIGVANTGLANAVVLGQTFKPGLELELDPGAFRMYAADVFTYDATGTELTITYNT